MLVVCCVWFVVLVSCLLVSRVMSLVCIGVVCRLLVFVFVSCSLLSFEVCGLLCFVKVFVVWGLGFRVWGLWFCGGVCFCCSYWILCVVVGYVLRLLVVCCLFCVARWALLLCVACCALD